MKGFFDKFKGFLSLEEEEESNPEALPADFSRRPNLIPIASKKSEILILEPTSYQEALQAAEQLKRKRILILNMERTEPQLARRIIDFLYGISYAQEGHMVNVTNNIFLFTPTHIGIRASGKREIKEGLFVNQKGENEN